MKNKIWRTAVILALVFAVLCTSYYFLLVLGYIIPNDLIASNWEESVYLINNLEEKRWRVMTGFDATRLDTFTDNLIFRNLKNADNLNPFVASMWNSGYTRYWMGTIPIIRFALVFMNYSTMRYINVFVVFSLFALVFSYVHKIMGKVHAFALAISLLLIQFWIFPLSFQYTPVYMITMVSILSILYLNHNEKLNLENMIYLFFVIGSLTNYFDLLTAPLLTFGLSFTLLFTLMNQENFQTLNQNLVCTLSSGLSWLSGYTFTWIANWTLTTLVTQENTFANAFNQITVRTVGGELKSLQELFNRLFSILLPRPSRFLLLLILIVWLIFFLRCRRSIKEIMKLTPLLCIIILPIVWIVLLRNHSQSHVYFVYRTLILTVYGTLSLLILSIDRRKKND